MKQKVQRTYTKIKNVLTKNQVFVVACVFLGITALVLYRLMVLSNITPDQAAIDDQKRAIKSVKFNQEAIDKIEALRDSNVKTPGTDLQKNRQNPFAE